MQQQNVDPKRIAIATYSYAPLMTGISAIVNDRIEVLLRAGHIVHLLHPDTSQWNIQSKGMYGLSDLQSLGNFSASTFPTVKNPFRRSMPDAASYHRWNDTEEFAKFSPELILVDEAAGLFGAASACLTGYKKPVGVEYGNHHNIPVVNLNHTDWRGYAEQYVGRTAVRMCWSLVKKRMRALTCGYRINLSPSRFLASRYLDFYQSPLEHICFHGVNCEVYRPENAQLPAALDSSTPIIVNSGRVAPEKNVMQLLTEFRELRKRVPKVKLVLLGDGPLLPKIRRIVEAEFKDSVLTPGAVFGDVLKWWLARADVYWTASTTENFSMGILEAMASGAPVVTYAAGGNTEQVEHEKSGMIAQLSVPFDFANQTERILNDRDFRSQLRQGARARALEFSNDVCVNRLLQRVFSPCSGNGV